MIPKNVDLRHVDSGLPEAEKRAIHRRAQQIAMLGTKWLLHPTHAPEKGAYHPSTGARLA
jgi:hypothetical protein